MTPEQQARQQIDRQLTQAGWLVQDHKQMNISAGLGVAVREFPLKGGTADYLLYADCRAVGVVEAKPEGHNLTGVETQSGKYLDGLPKNLPQFLLPLVQGFVFLDSHGRPLPLVGGRSAGRGGEDAEVGPPRTRLRGQVGGKWSARPRH